MASVRVIEDVVGDSLEVTRFAFEPRIILTSHAERSAVILALNVTGAKALAEELVAFLREHVETVEG